LRFNQDCGRAVVVYVALSLCLHIQGADNQVHLILNI